MIQAVFERADVEIVGINDLLDVDYIAYLLKYDSVHGTFKGDVKVENGHLVVDGKVVRITAAKLKKPLPNSSKTSIPKVIYKVRSTDFLRTSSVLWV